MTSPYASVGAQLVDQGFSAIPCRPGTKFPGAVSFKEWHDAPNWNRYCDRLPTQYETGVWEKWPDAGICVVMDHHLKVVDIDTEDADMRAAIMEVLPPSPVAKAGKKGLSLFYRGSPAIAARAFNARGERALDLIAYGKQTVIPPTIHPETGQPYRWLGDPLWNYTPEQLPELPDDIIDRLQAALEPFGYVPPVERDPVQGDADTAWREVNNIALSKLDMWVPSLGIPRLKRIPGGYKGVAIFRASGSGKPTSKRNLHLSIHRDGIRDYGDGDQAYTPISLVMAMSRCTWGEAFDWLREKLNLLPPRIDPTALIRNGLAKNGMLAVSEAEVAAHAEPQPHPANDNQILDPQDNDLPPDDSEPTTGLPDHMTRPPGLVGAITDWIADTASSPSRTLALGAALAYVGALAGRRYEGPTGLRTNIYVGALAKSGFGKEHPRACIKLLATKTNTIGKFFGGEQIMSASGLRNRIKKNPSTLYMIDEFGGFLRKITNPRGSNHEREIGDDLLKLTGSASSVFIGADYAGALGEPIHCPNVCIYGSSTPSTFWAALGSGNIADGFLPRFVLLDAGTQRPEQREVGSPSVPQSLVKAVEALVVHRNGGNLNGMTADGTTTITPIQVGWDDAAKEDWAEFRASMFKRMDSAAEEYEPILARVAENAGRLALIVAVGANPDRPFIDEGIMRWACDLALISARMLMSQAEERVADNERQAEYKRVLSIVAKEGKHGISRSYLAKRLRGSLDRRRLYDILDLLIEAQEIVQVSVKPDKGGPSKQHLWAAGLEPRIPANDSEHVREKTRELGT